MSIDCCLSQTDTILKGEERRIYVGTFALCLTPEVESVTGTLKASAVNKEELASWLSTALDSDAAYRVGSRRGAIDWCGVSCATPAS